MTMKRATRTKSKTMAKPKAKAKTKAMSQENMMAMWMKAATPAAGHKRLEPMVGKFRAKMSFVMEPGAPPQASDGTSEHRWVLDGRYVEQRYKGMSMGMPFEGIGYTGYDNIQKKYVGTWMDTFGTSIMNSIGLGKPTDKEMRFDCTCHEPSGKLVRFDSILRIQDRKRHSFEMWTKGPNGKRYRAMIVEYTRA